MNLTKIKSEYDDAISAAASDLHERFKRRLTALVKRIRPAFVITEIVCGMGTSLLKGDPVTVDYGGDEPDEDRYAMAPIETIRDHVYGNKYTNVVGLKDHWDDVTEICDILAEWVEITGGADIKFE